MITWVMGKGFGPGAVGVFGHGCGCSGVGSVGLSTGGLGGPCVATSTCTDMIKGVIYYRLI
jgi:hypothetical protein